LIPDAPRQYAESRSQGAQAMIENRGVRSFPDLKARFMPEACCLDWGLYCRTM